jgi:hypothetical protein
METISVVIDDYDVVVRFRFFPINHYLTTWCGEFRGKVESGRNQVIVDDFDDLGRGVGEAENADREKIAEFTADVDNFQKRGGRCKRNLRRTRRDCRSTLFCVGKEQSGS